LFHTPWYRKIMYGDRFLGIWKFLHTVDEEDASTDKQDKVYKAQTIYQ